MRMFIALAASAAILSVATLDTAEAQSSKPRRGEVVVKVKPRSYLDAGTSVLPGTYQGYSLGQTPWRAGDSTLSFGTAQDRLLPGRFGPAW